MQNMKKNNNNLPEKATGCVKIVTADLDNGHVVKAKMLKLSRSDNCQQSSYTSNSGKLPCPCLTPFPVLVYQETIFFFEENACLCAQFASPAEQ